MLLSIMRLVFPSVGNEDRYLMLFPTASSPSWASSVDPRLLNTHYDIRNRLCVHVIQDQLSSFAEAHGGVYINTGLWVKPLS